MQPLQRPNGHCYSSKSLVVLGMIIQCPSCSTKFAVDSAQLADVDSPRFHCSRCDHFFELGQSAQADAAKTGPVQAESPASPSQAARQLDLLGAAFPDADLLSPGRALDAELDEPVSVSLDEDLGLDEELELDDDHDVESTSIDFDVDLGERGTASSQSDRDPPTRISSAPVGGDMSASGSDRVAADLAADRGSERRFDLRNLTFDKEFALDEHTPVCAQWPSEAGQSPFEADLSNLHSQLRVKSGSAEHDAAGDVGDDNHIRPFSQRGMPATHSDESFYSSESTEVVPVSPSVSRSRLSRAADAELGALGRTEAAGDANALSSNAFVRFLRTAETDTEAEDEPADSVVGQSAAGPSTVGQSAAAEISPSWQVSAPSVERAPVRETLNDLELKPLPSRTRIAPTSEVAAPASEAPFLSRAGLLQRNDAAVSAIRRGSSWLAVAAASSIPLVMTAGIWWWSANLAHTPLLVKNILHLEPAGLQQLAPPGLEVVDLKSNFVTLDSGKKVLEIRGDVLNATMKTFGKVKLEAKVFSRDNKELGRVLVDSRSGLSGAKIEALSTQALEEMQHQTPNGLSKLDPNERVPFLIVIPETSSGEDLSAVQWFSTRIYSTETVSS
ncbi:MAG: zinc-ribbon domain-containing protein [Bdellovibrionota bacterium]